MPHGARDRVATGPDALIFLLQCIKSGGQRLYLLIKR